MTPLPPTSTNVEVARGRRGDRNLHLPPCQPDSSLVSYHRRRLKGQSHRLAEKFPLMARGDPRHYFCMMKEKNISVFVDESGSFDSAKSPSRYYVVTLVIHETDSSIVDAISGLESSLETLGLTANHCIHSGPLIRRESPYQDMTREDRQAIMARMMAFVRKAPIAHASFVADKRFASSPSAMHDALLRQMLPFVLRHIEFLSDCDALNIYYDNGQQQVKDLLKDAFAVLSSKAKFVPDVHPSDYRLFQAADFICTLALIRTKLENERHLSKSEISFFNSIQNLKKHFLKPIARKMLL